MRTPPEIPVAQVWDAIRHEFGSETYEIDDQGSNNLVLIAAPSVNASPNVVVKIPRISRAHESAQLHAEAITLRQLEGGDVALPMQAPRLLKHSRTLTLLP